jgi:hypothetical protein
MNLCRAGLMALTIYPLTRTLGAVGTATAVVLGISATIPVFLRASRGIVGGSYGELLARLVPCTAGAALVSVVVFAVKQQAGLLSLPAFIGLALLAVLGYCGFLLMLWKWFRYGPVGSLRMLARLI